MSDFVERFDTLMHHMLAYRPDLDPTFFTTRFIDGLQKDIKAIVLIQQPKDLETVVSLALLQEEIGEEGDKVQSLPITTNYTRVNSKAFSPVNVPAMVKNRQVSAVEDKN